MRISPPERPAGAGRAAKGAASVTTATTWATSAAQQEGSSHRGLPHGSRSSCGKVYAPAQGSWSLLCGVRLGWMLVCAWGPPECMMTKKQLWGLLFDMPWLL
jgi:hypothetical protein